MESCYKGGRFRERSLEGDDLRLVERTGRTAQPASITFTFLILLALLMPHMV